MIYSPAIGSAGCHGEGRRLSGNKRERRGDDPRRLDEAPIFLSLSPITRDVASLFRQSLSEK